MLCTLRCTHTSYLVRASLLVYTTLVQKVRCTCHSRGLQGQRGAVGTWVTTQTNPVVLMFCRPPVGANHFVCRTRILPIISVEETSDLFDQIIEKSGRSGTATGSLTSVNMHVHCQFGAACSLHGLMAASHGQMTALAPGAFVTRGHCFDVQPPEVRCVCLSGKRTYQCCCRIKQLPGATEAARVVAAQSARSYGSVLVNGWLAECTLTPDMV